MIERIYFRDLFERIERPLDVADDIEYQCIGVRWWGKGVFIRETKSGLQISKKRQYLIQEGDIVYNKLFAWRGAFAIAEKLVDGCIASDKFPTYKLISDVTLPEYLKVVFQAPALATIAESKSTGMAAMSKFTLNPPKFWELAIPVPSQHEQIRIVKTMQEFDDEARRVAAAGEQIENDCFRLPRVTTSSLTKDYPRVSLRKIGKIVRRGVTIQDDVVYTQITIGMNNTGIRLRGTKIGFEIGVKNQSRVSEGDLAFSRIDLRNGAIGFVPKDLDDAVVGNDFPVFQVEDSVSKDYLDWYFRTADFRQQSEAISAGTTNRRKTTRDNFLNLEIPLPDRAIQEAIALEVNQISRQAVAIERAREKVLKDVENLRLSFLQRIFQGNI
jgi:type I restriction enzyme S subunit